VTGFTAEQRERIPAVLDHAEELVGDRFHVPSFDHPRYVYDVRVLDELEAHEVPLEPGLAQLIRYGRAVDGRTAAPRGRLSGFHRICLHDERILECEARDGLGLPSLLLVVLAHELIHLVRFTIPETTFHAPVSIRHEEEREVDRLTRELLRTYPDEAVRRAMGTITGPSDRGPS